VRGTYLNTLVALNTRPLTRGGAATSPQPSCRQADRSALRLRERGEVLLALLKSVRHPLAKEEHQQNLAPLLRGEVAALPRVRVFASHLFKLLNDPVTKTLSHFSGFTLSRSAVVLPNTI
jgi:hypothetical protein